MESEQTLTSVSNTGKAIPEYVSRNVSQQTNNETEDVHQIDGRYE